MSSINLQGSNQDCHSFSISCSSTIIAWCHLLIFKAATRAATHFLFQNSLTFSWLFTIFQTFSTASQLPLQLSSAIKSSNRALTFRELNNHLIREWGQFCKFMFLKIKETAIAICFQKFSKFPDFCRFFFFFFFFFQFSLTWKYSFFRVVSLTVATLSNTSAFPSHLEVSLFNSLHAG